MGYKRPSLTDLMARVDQDLLSRLPGSQAALAVRVTQALATSQAGVTHGLYGYLQWLERQLFPETCDDDLVHLHSAGVPRRQAAKASGSVVFSGTNGAVIVTGTTVQVDGLEYVTTAEATISAGTATASVEAVQAGAAADQSSGAELSLVSPLPGVNSAALVGVNGLQGGADLEVPSTWRDRILRRRARVPRGGAMGDWESWALEVPGVTRAWESPRGMGAGSVVIRIMADDAADGPLPSQQLLDSVFDYITQVKNVGAHLYVIAPTPVDFAPQLAVVPDTQEVRASVAASLQDLIERENEPGGTLLITRVRHAISSAAGIEDYDLQWPMDNVIYGAGELPIWGTIQWL